MPNYATKAQEGLLSRQIPNFSLNTMIFFRIYSFSIPKGRYSGLAFTSSRQIAFLSLGLLLPSRGDGWGYESQASREMMSSIHYLKFLQHS
jgi:hypothetical protein